MKWKWAFYLAGAAAIGWGFLGLVTNGVRVQAWLPFFVGPAIVHDFVVVPAAVVVGALMTRVVPGWLWPIVRAGLVISAAVTAVAIPFVLGFGRSDDLPSALPLDYGGGLVLVLTVVWLGVLVIGLVAWWRRSRAGPGDRRHNA